ncbi:MAG: flagellar protein FlaG [Desulfotomaculum sp.]|nr:flagellar protein FlaG [Desulfotomaculum sp.]
MKVGAGGLQSMLVHDHITIRQLDPGRKLGAEQQQQQAQSLAKKPVNLPTLFKAVDRLNQAAQMFNYPLLFKLVRDKDNKLKVLVRNKKTGDAQELEPEQAIEFAKQRENTTGKKVDGYG